MTIERLRATLETRARILRDAIMLCNWEDGKLYFEGELDAVQSMIKLCTMEGGEKNV